MTTMAAQITSLRVVYSTVYSDANQRTIKAPCHWPLCGEFTGTGEFPAQRASYAENVSIWWRHHESKQTAAITPVFVGYVSAVVCLRQSTVWGPCYWHGLVSNHTLNKEWDGLVYNCAAEVCEWRSDLTQSFIMDVIAGIEVKLC